MANPHPAALPVETLLQDCDIEKTRRGGPGGQHRNKVETAIVIKHRPTSIVGEASERRSQHANRQMATRRLRLNLAVGVRCPLPADGHLSELWHSRRQNNKIQISSEHEDFPALLAESLDQIADAGFETAIAASHLQVSGSQLVKLLKKFPPALIYVNGQRAKLGLGKLK